MPKNKVPRYKTIRCQTRGCNRVIKRFDRSKYPNYKVPAADVLSAIRHHYKKYHPGKFREQTKKAVKTKRKRSVKEKKYLKEGYVKFLASDGRAYLKKKGRIIRISPEGNVYSATWKFKGKQKLKVP